MQLGQATQIHWTETRKTNLTAGWLLLYCTGEEGGGEEKEEKKEDEEKERVAGTEQAGELGCSRTSAAYILYSGRPNPYLPVHSFHHVGGNANFAGGCFIC